MSTSRWLVERDGPLGLLWLTFDEYADAYVWTEHDVWAYPYPSEQAAREDWPNVVKEWPEMADVNARFVEWVSGSRRQP